MAKYFNLSLDLRTSNHLSNQNGEFADRKMGTQHSLNRFARNRVQKLKTSMVDVEKVVESSERPKRWARKTENTYSVLPQTDLQEPGTENQDWRGGLDRKRDRDSWERGIKLTKVHFFIAVVRGHSNLSHHYLFTGADPNGQKM